MNPPSRPIRTELNDALVGGIRKRGPDAFGMMIDALARLGIGVITFFVLYGLTDLAGRQPSSLGPYAALTGASGLTSWLVTRRSAAAPERGRF
jgi:hypothetical protein